VAEGVVFKLLPFALGGGGFEGGADGVAGRGGAGGRPIANMPAIFVGLEIQSVSELARWQLPTKIS